MNHGYLDPFVGNELKKIREDQKLTVEFVADSLRLNKTYIEDIENNNFTRLPHTYLKGYVRAYAKLLEIPDADINIYLMGANKQNCIKGWKKFSGEKQISATHPYMQWLTLTIASALFVLVTLWWKNDNNQVTDDLLKDKKIVAVAQNNQAE